MGAFQVELQRVIDDEKTTDSNNQQIAVDQHTT